MTGYRTREDIEAMGYEPICIPGPESLLFHDCIGHDHVPGEAMSPYALTTEQHRRFSPTTNDGTSV